MSINQCLSTYDGTGCDIKVTYRFVFVRPNASFEACIFYDQALLSYMNIGEVILLNERFH